MHTHRHEQKLKSESFTTKLGTDILWLFFIFDMKTPGDQGLHIGDWNNLQAGCSYPAEKRGTAEKKGQWSPCTAAGTD